MKAGIPDHLIYEATAAYDRWLKLFLPGVIALVLVLRVVLAPEDFEGPWLTFGLAAFYALLLHAVMPRRFLVFQDRLRIVLGRPFGLNIPFSSIKEARSVTNGKMYVYWGIKFATSAGSVVEIVRHKGLNIIISPNDREMFLEQFNQALQMFKDGGRI
ncbi:hypothetical protein ACFLRP_00475 [Bacteroidota bacterium]